MLRAEIVSIGDELTSGQRLDTNSQWLSQRLGEIGVPVVAHVTVADDRAANVEVFRQAVARAEIVIATGGLGPTADDLTREVLAEVAGVPLELDPAQLEHIQRIFSRRQRPMPERNRVQALFPVGSQPIFNPEGTAPGVAMRIPRADGTACHVFALPGVPAEMFQMWAGSVRPALFELGAGQQVLVHHRIKCFGVGESDLEQMLPDLIRRGRVPQVGITVSDATITLRLTAAGLNEAACREQMRSTIDTIHECLSSLVFGEEEDELEDVVLRQLAQAGATLATVEWHTAGLLARSLSRGETASPTFAGGVILRAGDKASAGLTAPVAAAAADLARAIAAYPSGPASEIEAAARRLATAAREAWGTDYALIVGPARVLAGAAGEAGDVPLALATRDRAKARTVSLAGHSALIRPRLAKQALDFLRLAQLNPASLDDSAR
ncbi:MAG: CinA family nicotinamide mononucleotide deamidase-related protein [Planctomycetes bacterium]|nr:CinA family nicotinamide mononucleotide deamidase-related protein [Planctomycetota bacterium]